MAADPQAGGLWDAVLLAASKLWPGLAGALVALRWLPVETTRTDRFFAAIGGFVAAANLGPAISDVVGISSQRVEAGIVFATGLFGMAVAGEILATLKQLQLAEIARDAIRKIFRIGG